jgi:predicted CopG family antitoxin
MTALPPRRRVRHDDGVNEDFQVQIVSDSPMSGEELAAATRELLDDLNEVQGVEATEVTGPAEEGTRDFGAVVLGVAGISLFAIPSGIRAKRHLKHLSDVIKRYQERHKGKKLRVIYADGSKLEGENVSEHVFAKMMRNMPQRSGDLLEQEKSLD